MWQSEKQFANLLTKQKRKWQYPARRFKIGHITYRPDFYLPKENLYIEVIKTRSSLYQRKKSLKLMKKYHPHIKILIVNTKGEKYPSKTFLSSLPNHMISLKLNPNLKKTLAELSNIDGRSETYHLERALTNYFKAKRIIKE